MARSQGTRLIAQNRKAYHDYFIEETYEAGLVLTGTEIKSIRKGSVSLRDAYARVDEGEVYIYNMHIAPYEQGNRLTKQPARPRTSIRKRRRRKFTSTASCSTANSPGR
ncbi:SsrA-binding protein [Alicyclobacillus mali (ex Roth et al. 2021)]|uniref:SsrA-binding protein n=1 Tax=Alicyclobacillus mali (ex Roth et al. 2021) TaxID=1123961 RepID=UPI0023F2D029|nr:SsrA-binding protein [Alicyclobacillus mali (ex Roth et al. 2021)]